MVLMATHSKATFALNCSSIDKIMFTNCSNLLITLKLSHLLLVLYINIK